MNNDLKTSSQWAKLLADDIVILNADGWDSNEAWSSELITKEEFEHRFMQSTVIMPNGVDAIWQ